VLSSSQTQLYLFSYMMEVAME